MQERTQPSDGRPRQSSAANDPFTIRGSLRLCPRVNFTARTSNIRLIKYLGISLAAGIVINTFVAYILIIVRSQLAPLRWVDVEAPWRGLELAGFGRRRLLLVGHGSGGVLLQPGWGVSERSPMPRWYRLPAPPTRRMLAVAAVDLYGWPAPTLTYGTNDISRAEIWGAIRLLDTRRSTRHYFVGSDAWSQYLLPYRVVLGGFVLNTLFYGSLCAALICVADMLVRLRRRRRLHAGLCDNCSYNVTGLDVCPECGAQHR